MRFERALYGFLKGAFFDSQNLVSSSLAGIPLTSTSSNMESVRLLKSLITTSVVGLVLVATVTVAFVLGATLHRPVSDRQFVLVASEVHFEPAPQRIDDGENIQGLNVPIFVYQGVLNDANGDPVVGPVDLSFSLYSIGFVVFEHASLDTSVTPDAFGRFQVDVPLGDSTTMSDYDDLFLEIRETGGVLIANIPVQYTPRAWYSDHARTSTFAVTAQNADLAQQADGLTNDQTVTLMLNKPFEPYGPPYAVPKAARVGNVVHLSGTAVAFVSALPNQSLATLPVGMRPSERMILTFEAYRSLDFDGFSPHRFEVYPDGRILCTDLMNDNEYFSLNGTSFIVD